MYKNNPYLEHTKYTNYKRGKQTSYKNVTFFTVSFSPCWSVGSLVVWLGCFPNFPLLSHSKVTYDDVTLRWRWAPATLERSRMFWSFFFSFSIFSDHSVDLVVVAFVKIFYPARKERGINRSFYFNWKLQKSQISDHVIDSGSWLYATQWFWTSTVSWANSEPNLYEDVETNVFQSNHWDQGFIGSPRSLSFSIWKPWPRSSGIAAQLAISEFQKVNQA